MESVDIRSIKFRVIALVALMIAPLLIILAIVSLGWGTANRLTIELQRQDSARDLSATVDREFLELKGMLTGVAMSVSAGQASNFAVDQLLAKKANASRLTRIWRFSANGTRVDQPLNSQSAPQDRVLANDFVNRVFGGEFAISDIAGEGMNNTNFTIAVPIFNENNIVEEGLAAEVSVAAFKQVFEDAAMKNTWVALVVDPRGRFVARSVDAKNRVGTPARPELVAVAKADNESGTFDNITLEGTTVLNSYVRSPLTHWTTVVAVPKSELEAPLQRALVYTLFGIFSALGLSILAAAMMAARIAKPVSNLSRYADALALGQKVEPEKYRITEIENVRASLDRAMAKSARLSTLVASSGDAIIGVDREGKIDSWNKGAETLFGYKAEEVIGKSKTILVPEDLRAEYDEQRTFIADGKVVRSESIRLNSNGQRIDVESIDAPIIDTRGKTMGYSSTLRDISERTAAREHRALLMRELAHRTKNQLAIVQSIAYQTKRNSTSLDGFITAFNARIQGLSASHDILAKQQWQDIPIIELVKSQIAVLTSEIDKAFRITGPDIALTAVHAEALGLALHELTTNSIKYGALSLPQGRVAITWQVESGAGIPHVIFEWVESGGPTILKQPTQQGFGSRVLDKIVALSLGGKNKTEYRPNGLYWWVIWDLKR